MRNLGNCVIVTEVQGCVTYRCTDQVIIRPLVKWQASPSDMTLANKYMSLGTHSLSFTKRLNPYAGGD